jgi:hypothetical protein
LIDFIVLNATFNNISAISWRPVLVVEEVGVPGENHRPEASNWKSVHDYDTNDHPYIFIVLLIAIFYIHRYTDTHVVIKYTARAIVRTQIQQVILWLKHWKYSQ